MKTLINTVKNIWNDESAQGIVEYGLVLVVVVALALTFKKQILEIVSDKLGTIGSDIKGFTSQ